MIKVIRILEVPLYLLVIALGCLEEGATTTAIILTLISIVRLIVNSITDTSVYKR
tara:strand:+ start:335 stop:499 length:165 start_codon:yes stop_codon:yes gene_type:complete